MTEIPTARVVHAGAPVLGAAPRVVPRRIAVQLALGSPSGIGAGLLIAMAVVFVLIPLVPRWRYDASTLARVVAIEQHGVDHEGDPIEEVTVTFVDRGGVARTAIGTYYAAIEKGPRRIVYRSEDPTKIDVERWGLVLGIMLILAGGSALVGIGFAIRAVRQARRAVRLLRFGKPTTGTLVAKAAPSDGATTMTFAYVVDGKPYRHAVATKTPAVLEDDAAEPMLYDAADPAHATTLDHLPGGPRIVGGQLVSKPGLGFSLYLAPAVAVIALAAIVVIVARMT